MAVSLLNVLSNDRVQELLNHIDEGNEGREDMERRAMSRETASSIIHACLWAYSARPTDTAGGYAWLSLWEALGINIFESTIVKATPRDCAGHGTASTSDQGCSSRDAKPLPQGGEL